MSPIGGRGKQQRKNQQNRRTPHTPNVIHFDFVRNPFRPARMLRIPKAEEERISQHAIDIRIYVNAKRLLAVAGAFSLGLHQPRRNERKERHLGHEQNINIFSR